MSMVGLKALGERLPLSARPFLPTSLEEMRARGWDELDIVIVSGDAYVDHPAFGAAVIGEDPRGCRLQGGDPCPA